MAMSFGELLRRLREARPSGRRRSNLYAWTRQPSVLSQNGLAALAGINVAYVNKMERELRGPPRRETVERLAAALDLDALGTARLLVAAGYWPWTELDDDGLEFVLRAGQAIVEGDWRLASGAIESVLR